MKLNPILAACAFAAIVPDVLAAPVRLIVVSSWGPETSQPDVSKFRLGHAARPMNDPLTGRITFNTVQPKKHGCGGAAARKAKMIEIQNKFRGIFGLPLVESKDVTFLDPSTPPQEPERFHILPFGPGSSLDSEHAPTTYDHIHLANPHRYEELGMERTARTFPERLQRSLTMLGTWEGRAVAFVLGCGLGVLIRMFWVFALLFIRAYRGKNRSDPDMYSDIVIHDVIFISPEIDGQPDSYPDEKASGPKEDAEVVVAAPPAYDAPATDKD